MMNFKSGLTAAALAFAATTAFAAPLHVNLVDNGDFESNDLAGWVETGIPDFNGAGTNCTNPATAYTGNCNAYIGPFIMPGGLQQTIDVGSAGLNWTLSFALRADGDEFSGPNSFTVSFGDDTLLSLTDVAIAGYTLYQFSGVTTAESMTLAFEFYNDGGYFNFDSVALTLSAAEVPEPATTALLGAGLAGLLALRRRKTV